MTIVEQWTRFIWQVAAEPSWVISGVRKITSETAFELDTAAFENPGITYQDICYTAAKRRQLARNYWDTEQVDAAVERLVSRKGKDHSSVSIQLKAGAKDSRSQGYCMQNMVISVSKEESFVDVYYRSTEVTQKFLADLIFFSEVLPGVFERIGIKPKVIRFKFANTYLSAVFMPIFFRYEPRALEFFEHLEQHDPKFYRTCGLATRRFFNETHNYSYRTRVKMFEYWKEHVDEPRLIKLKRKLKALTGTIDEGDEDEE